MARTAQERRNLALVLEMYEKVLVPFDPTDADRYIAPDYIQHSQLAAPGRAAMKTFLDTVRAANPYASSALKRALVDGDLVALHYHVKPSPDVPGFVVCDIFRVADGMIVEHWDILEDIRPDRPNPHDPF